MAILDIRGAIVGQTAAAIKAPCLVATTGSNITLAGVQAIDGVTVGNNNERVLVKDQTSPDPERHLSGRDRELDSDHRFFGRASERRLWHAGAGFIGPGQSGNFVRTNLHRQSDRDWDLPDRLRTARQL